jgi:hypothetical protein
MLLLTDRRNASRTAARRSFVMAGSLWLTLAALAAGVQLATAGSTNRAKEIHTKLANLFDYEHYKRAFGKISRSRLEDATRRTYFYARAMAVFVAGVQYERRAIDYYLALNDMSDWSPQEQALLTNKNAHGMLTRSKARREAELGNGPLPFMPAVGEKPEEIVRQFLLRHADEPDYRDLLIELGMLEPAGHQRRKRDTAASSSGQEPQELPLDQLTHPPGRHRRSRKSISEQAGRVQSDKPNCGRTEPEPMAHADQKLEIVEWKSVSEIRTSPRQLELPLGSTALRRKQAATTATAAANGLATGDSDHEAAPGDEVFVDHRRSGCLNPVRRQGKCGACYAFVSIALAEFLYCKSTGTLASFSEQYMVDCGNGRFESMYGCDGSNNEDAANFIHNFGVELLANYPYSGSEHSCPYAASDDLAAAGYIRMGIASFIEVPTRLWETFVEHTPLYIVVEASNRTFNSYGGGVHEMKCAEMPIRGAYEGDENDGDGHVEAEGGPSKADAEPKREPDYHAMLLIGHGRQDGHEYWLIRNSYGESWGEKGYYKLSKRAAESCILFNEGYAFGIDDELKMRVRPRKNRHYDQSIVAASRKAVS